jgi:hypothetical protein
LKFDLSIAYLIANFLKSKFNAAPDAIAHADGVWAWAMKGQAHVEPRLLLPTALASSQQQHCK